jgi:glutamine---fructose-6-phosphate transaminase (isomerizing)
MCGIVGLLLANDSICNTLLFKCLKCMQNRGYDSAGICTISPNGLKMSKYASNDVNAFDMLEESIPNHSDAWIGIGHTRWATHGGKTIENAHPHASMGGKIIIAHNGIIENFREIRDDLVDKNYVFKSQTDTEVLANLLEYLYLQDTQNTPEQHLCNCIGHLKSKISGTWGLVVICTDTPDTLYCTRHGSPLLVSCNEQMAMVVSEQSGFDKSVTDYVVLKNYDICILNKKNGKINMTTEHQYTSTFSTIGGEYCETPTPYAHWTLKEIYEQPQSIERAICFGGRIASHTNVMLGGLDDKKEELIKVENLIILGCGTSRNAGSLGVHYFKDLCEFKSVQVFDGADFSSVDIPKNTKTGAIFLSQSGETRDLHRCIQIAHQHNIITIGVVNVVDSLIAREVDCGCYLNAGKEVGVASTKSFTSQCIILSLIAIWFSQNQGINENKRRRYIENLTQLRHDVSCMLNDIEHRVDKLTPLFSHSSCFVLGKGWSEPIAHEGALKIKEISYIHSEGYSTSSLKHGPFALLDSTFPVILIGLNDANLPKTENAYNEIISRDAKVVFITNDIKCAKDNTIVVPNNSIYSELIAGIAIQMIAYKLALERNANPDMPKNLAKVVTVE